MKKRGMVVLEVAIELVIGAIILTFLLYAGTQLGKGEVIKKINIAKDLGLIFGMLESSTVDTIVDYKRDISKYIIKIEENCVKVLLDIQDTAPASYCFPPTKQIRPHLLVNPKKLFITKKNKEIKLLDEDPPKTLSDTCGAKPNYEVSEDFKIFIDPLFEELNQKQTDSLLRLTNSLYNTLQTNFENIETSLLSTITTVDKVPTNEIKRKENEADLVIKLIISNKEEKANIFAKFPYNTDKESLEKIDFLACKSVNSLLDIKDSSFDYVLKQPTDSNLFTNKNTLLFEFSINIFSKEDSENRAIAYSIGNKLGEGIINVLSKTE